MTMKTIKVITAFLLALGGYMFMFHNQDSHNFFSIGLSLMEFYAAFWIVTNLNAKVFSFEKE